MPPLTPHRISTVRAALAGATRLAALLFLTLSTYNFIVIFIGVFDFNPAMTFRIYMRSFEVRTAVAQLGIGVFLACAASRLARWLLPVSPGSSASCGHAHSAAILSMRLLALILLLGGGYTTLRTLLPLLVSEAPLSSLRATWTIMAPRHGVTQLLTGAALGFAAPWLTRWAIPVVPDCCPGCGYARTTGRCPECGLSDESPPA